jgi:hypothetical protein
MAAIAGDDPHETSGALATYHQDRERIERRNRMIRSLILAAAAASLFAFTSAAPAQARMANPGLNQIAPANILTQDVQYRRDRYRHHRRWHHRHRYRHCYNQRVRVRVAGGYFVWRTHRRCGWRWR